MSEDLHITKYLKKVLKPVLKTNNDYFFKIVENWNTLIPESWINNATPYKINYNGAKANYTLVVSVKNSSLGFRFSYDSLKVIDKINEFLGKNIVNKITFINNNV